MNKDILKRIESEGNSRLKLIKKLRHKKYRDSENEYVIEGVNLFREAFCKKAEIEFVIVAEDFTDRFAQVIDGFQDSVSFDIFLIDRKLFEKISLSENGSGVIAVVSKNTYTMEGASENIKEGDNILVLDRLQDPGNLGTIIRTAAAAGYRWVFALKGTVDLYSEKVLRSTAGMIFDIPVQYISEPDILISFLRSKNKKLTVTLPGSGTPYYKADIKKNTALVIGNEGNGISDMLIEAADQVVNIPMYGEVESLNAAISAGILMYEAVRK